MSPEVQHRGGYRGKPRRVVESDEEEDANIVPSPTPRLQVTQEVRRDGICAILQPSSVTDECRFHFISSFSEGQGEGDGARTHCLSLQHRRPFEEDRRFEPKT